ncbi:5'-nucleotidase [Flavobacterium sp. DG1-102-2]|uniref:5'-nucleotidase n=1 Tax=Flavobacterium sp. DG1-102-2 TaxID=3081663 RepID=UPI002949EF69|nr:5'-nucleotidase [Flavobacterium sp. DG1-102-2]MDV6169978.1 5'-nucleotidase [Flavobacterium sp. DG1-102-2]
MRIFKKYNTYATRFVLFLTLLPFFAACATTGLHNTKIEARKTPITASLPETASIENFIAPYRIQLDKDLDSVLAYAPETFDKSKGKWSNPMGNLLAEATFAKADKLFFAKENRHIDLCMLNHGGIRSIIPKGQVTTRTAFEIMPFENSVKIVALKGTQVREMAAYIAREKRAHPLAGITITLDANGMVKNITVQGKLLDNNTVYYVASIDYLIGGGDNMAFFATNEGVFDPDYKLRDLYLDYFKETDTLPIITTQHIITE